MSVSPINNTRPQIEYIKIGSQKQAKMDLSEVSESLTLLEPASQSKVREYRCLDLPQVLCGIVLEYVSLESMKGVGLIKDSTSKEKDSTLIQTARLGACVYVELLLDAGVSGQGKDGALKEAAFNRHIDIVKLFLFDAGVSEQGKEGALKEAVLWGHIDIVKLLLDAGVSSQGKDGALKEAASRGREDIVKLLLVAGVSGQGKDGALKEAAFNRHIDIVKLFLFDAGVSEQGKEGALKEAVFHGHTDIVKLLLGAGVSEQGRKAALQSIITRGGNLYIVKLLA